MNKLTVIFVVLLVLEAVACSKQHKDKVVAPWGEVVSDTVSEGNNLSVADLISNGELIILTMYGPDTYYDYHGHGMGTQYLLSEKFAKKLGVSLRVEVCKDTTEMIKRLMQGDGDLIAFPLPKNKKLSRNLLYCGASIDSLHVQWAVSQQNHELADSLNAWFKPRMIDDMQKEQKFLLSSRSVTRHVFAPFIDRGKGVISAYDYLFKRYAPAARMDWRMMAAQCYQESCFDPQAISWAGARGLMQIMPSTAAHLGLSMDDIHTPEHNIMAAAKYMLELQSKFRSVPSATERQLFALAAYNGGFNHVQDAMALTRKNGGNPYKWAHVARYILALQQSTYYNDPVVRYGYMRGSETVDYVDRIRQRYAQYRGVPYGGSSVNISENETTLKNFTIDFYNSMTPHRAKKKHRFHI